MFANHDEIYRFKRKFSKYSGDKVLRRHRNIRGGILEVKAGNRHCLFNNLPFFEKERALILK